VAAILVVDDDPAMRALIRLVLEAEGHDVDEASSGEDALSHVTLDPPDLILLDLMMPGMDGWRFLDELHLRGLRSGTRVVIVSALSDTDSIERGRNRGAHGHLVKPFELEALLEAVKTAMEDAPEELLAKQGRMGDLATLLRELDQDP
jgi:CheY-like chemotaxis protein